MTGEVKNTDTALQLALAGFFIAIWYTKLINHMELRSKELTEKYHEHMDQHKDSCPLCLAVDEIKDYTYWKILPNHFPYDLFAKVHHMLVVKRHTAEKDLNEAEMKEYHQIKE